VGFNPFREQDKSIVDVVLIVLTVVVIIAVIAWALFST
jgi:hypothetical protein